MNSATNDWNERFKIVRDKVKWNEAVEVVQKHRTIVRTDSDSTFGVDSTPPQPPPPPPPPPESFLTKKCSSCSCHRSSGSRRLRAGCEEPVLQQVEAKLYNADIEESISAERVEASRERLRRAAQVLEAQVMFTQSLDLKARALARLTQVTGNFACKEVPLSSTLDTILDDIRWDVGGLTERLAEVTDAAGAAAETPDHLCQLLDDFQDKNEGFHTTSKRFSQYLRTSGRVTNDKLRKLEYQYNSIRGTYDQSRELLEKELSKLIEERHAIVDQCFSKLFQLQETMVQQDKQFLVLSKEVSKSLQEPRKQARRCSQNCSSKHDHRN